MVYAMLILYYRQGWLSIPCFTPGKNYIPATTISIIIPARNEAENIAACIRSILAQDYPVHLFEVLVIDDHSTDDTAAIIQRYRDKNVHLVSLSDFVTDAINSYKKKAIEIAIGRATGELIVTTDADCIASPCWLTTLAEFYEKNEAAFIAMPVKFTEPKSFLAIFQSLDFMTLQGITGASVFKKVHSMCNGANLAYPKKAYMEVGGFKGIDAIASGDDMLLMHKIYTKFPGKVFFLQAREVIIRTRPMDSLKGFLHQRIRWASKADKYDDKRIFAVLLLVYFLNVWLLLLAIGAFFFPLLPIFLVLIVGKTLVEILYLYPVAGFFREQRLLWWFPVAQPFHILYTIFAGWLGKFGSYQWKERTVQ